MHKTYIPALYKPTLDAYDTQRAIAYIKQTFQDEFSSALNLKRVSAPLFVTENSGLNDNLNGYERPVSSWQEGVDIINDYLANQGSGGGGGALDPAAKEGADGRRVCPEQGGTPGPPPP